MVVLSAIFFFIFGLIIGSFLNVVIYRLNTSKSLGGRSACMVCRHTLSWYELIPVFSFLGLLGRCRKCKTQISIQYPMVEILTGLIFMALFFKFKDIFYVDIFQFGIMYDYYAVMFSFLLVIAVYDLRHKIIPDVLVFTFGALAFAGLFFFSHSDSIQFGWHIPSTLELLSGVFVALPFAFFWAISGGRWMGFGDAKLALGIGWLLGISSAFSGMVLAFWVGAVIGVSLMILSKHGKMRRIGMKSEIPFAPFLVLGAFFAFICEFNLFVI